MHFAGCGIWYGNNLRMDRIYATHWPIHSRPCKEILVADLGGSIACPRKLQPQPAAATNSATVQAKGVPARFAEMLAELEMGGECHDAIKTKSDSLQVPASYQQCVKCVKAKAKQRCSYCFKTNLHSCSGHAGKKLYLKPDRCPPNSTIVGGDTDDDAIASCRAAFPRSEHVGEVCLIFVI